MVYYRAPEPGAPRNQPAQDHDAGARSQWVFSYWQLVNERLQHFEIPWRDEPDHFDRLLQALHCRRQFALGERGAGVWIEVYRNERTTPELKFHYLLTLNTPDAYDIVLVHDLPDLLTFLEHLAPTLQLAMATSKREFVVWRAESTETIARRQVTPPVA
jgi:hypothetical protein